MANNLTLSTSIILLLVLLPLISARGPREVESWFNNLRHAKQKVAKLHFFFHDVVGGRNPTAIRVAQANSTYSSPTLFGLVTMIDNPLTVGSEGWSRVLGRAQGITGSASAEEMSFIMTVNFVFSSGKYNGSSISVVGHNPINQEYRELAVVGGSGVFRLARGVATAETARFDAGSGNAVVEYHVMVLHY